MIRKGQVWEKERRKEEKKERGQERSKDRMNRAGGKRKEGKKEKRERRQAGKRDTWILESLWKQFRSLWDHFDVTLGLLWVYEGHFGITLASPGGLLGGFWVNEGGFGELWSYFEAILGSLGSLLWAEHGFRPRRKSILRAKLVAWRV